LSGASRFVWFWIFLSILFSLAIWLTVIILLSGERVRAAFAHEGTDANAEVEERPRSGYEGYDDDDPPRKAPKFPGDKRITDQS